MSRPFLAALGKRKPQTFLPKRLVVSELMPAPSTPWSSPPPASLVTDCVPAEALARAYQRGLAVTVSHAAIIETLTTMSLHTISVITEEVDVRHSSTS